MKQITSFTINHDYLKPGMYISRVDGDVITYDLFFLEWKISIMGNRIKSDQI